MRNDIIIGLTQNYLRRYVFYQGLFFEVHIIFNVMNDVCMLSLCVHNGIVVYCQRTVDQTS